MTTAVSKSSEFSCGLMHEVAVTACKVGWTPEHFANLAHSEDKMRQVLSFLDGCADIKIVEHIVDLDADPVLPNGWKVEDHKKGGKWKFDPRQVSLHLSSNQMCNKTIVGNELRKELAREPVANANLLDWYLAHPEFIPEEWKGKAVFFWGTIYRRSVGHLYVRCLCWNGGGWHWHCYWLNRVFDSCYLALVLAS